MTNADVNRIINSDEVQSVLNRKKPRKPFTPRKRNPLKNFGALVKLNPYAVTQRRQAIRVNLTNIAKKAKRRADWAARPKGAKKEAKKPTKKPTKKVPKDKPDIGKVKKTIKKGRPRRASPRWLSVLKAPAIAPARAPEEIIPKYQ